MDLEPLYQKLEAALDAHPGIKRIEHVGGEPRIEFSRSGVTVRVNVMVAPKRKPQDIHNDGTTAAEAVDKLIGSLDFWVQAIKDTK